MFSACLGCDFRSKRAELTKKGRKHWKQKVFSLWFSLCLVFLSDSQRDDGCVDTKYFFNLFLSWLSPPAHPVEPQPCGKNIFNAASEPWCGENWLVLRAAAVAACSLSQDKNGFETPRMGVCLGWSARHRVE